MTKKPTWPKVWLEIAEAYYTPKSRRTKRQRLITAIGLCWAIEDVYGFGCRVSDKLAKAVNLKKQLGFGWWEWCRDGEIKRAQFAEHMAGIPHADFENFINGGSHEFRQD